MTDRAHTDIGTFFVVGINYKKTDAQTRGLFAINNDQYLLLLQQAANQGLKELFVLSTCNRTEVYGFAESASQLCQLICDQTNGDAALFLSKAYIKSGRQAIEHLFEVAAGLDSQILGDYEIIGQLKQAVKVSKSQQMIGAYLERLINSVLQSSKDIKTNTQLSGGTVSVSFAAIQYIRESVPDVQQKNILLLGTGKIGRNTCKNLVDYLGTTKVTLINRTFDKAQALAAELGLHALDIAAMNTAIQAADIILVATNAATPIISAAQLQQQSNKFLIDLSIPYNVDPAAKSLPNVTLVNVDELSKIKDSTLQQRIAEVPAAKAIIHHHINEFFDWHQMRKHVPVLKAVKNKLEQLQHCDLYLNAILQTSTVKASNEQPAHKIQKVINGMAIKMRQQDQRGCYYIEAINEYMAPVTNTIS